MRLTWDLWTNSDRKPKIVSCDAKSAKDRIAGANELESENERSSYPRIVRSNVRENSSLDSLRLYGIKSSQFNWLAQQLVPPEHSLDGNCHDFMSLVPGCLSGAPNESRDFEHSLRLRFS